MIDGGWKNPHRSYRSYITLLGYIWYLITRGNCTTTQANLTYRIAYNSQFSVTFKLDIKEHNCFMNGLDYTALISYTNI